MSIEALQRAAAAAGYAMVPPDDAETEHQPAQAPAALPAPARERTAPPSDMLTSATSFVRTYLPVSFGGRATA